MRKLKSFLANHPQVQASQLELEILETAALDNIEITKLELMKHRDHILAYIKKL